MSRIDAVAEAIHKARFDHKVWPCFDALCMDQSRRMAQAAIDALGLTPEWAALNKAGGNEIPYFPHRTREGADKHVQTAVNNHEGLKKHLPKSSEAPDMGVVSRLVSPWTEVTS